jgi:hypothetical protein
MFRDGRLHEERAHRRIEPRGEEGDDHLPPAAGEERRIVGDGDGVVVDDADDRVVPVLQRDPVLHRAEVISDVQLAGRLDPTEDP